jgi:hypothetical protein
VSSACSCVFERNTGSFVRLGFNCYVVPTLAFMDGCYEPVEIILRFVTEYQFNIYKRSIYISARRHAFMNVTK